MYGDWYDCMLIDMMSSTAVGTSTSAYTWIISFFCQTRFYKHFTETGITSKRHGRGCCEDILCILGILQDLEIIMKNRFIRQRERERKVRQFQCHFISYCFDLSPHPRDARVRNSVFKVFLDCFNFGNILTYFHSNFL